MGLSTHVETSDRGSRRHARATNEERIDGIDEVEDESGRTSPQGTIGEVHDYMSEHITSNLINRQSNKGGNQSVKGAKKTTTVSTIARQGQGSKFDNKLDSSIDACSNFAVVREKVQLTNDNRHI